MNDSSSISEKDSGILQFHAQQQLGMKENTKMVLDAIIQLASMTVSLAKDMQESDHRHQLMMMKLKAELKVS